MQLCSSNRLFLDPPFRMCVRASVRVSLHYARGPSFSPFEASFSSVSSFCGSLGASPRLVTAYRKVLKHIPVDLDWTRVGREFSIDDFDFFYETKFYFNDIFIFARDTTERKCCQTGKVYRAQISRKVARCHEAGTTKTRNATKVNALLTHF